MFGVVDTIPPLGKQVDATPQKKIHEDRTKPRPEDTLYDTQNKDVYDSTISFVNKSYDCCVLIVDIIDSTEISTTLNDGRKIAQFYSAFLNELSKTAKMFNSKVVKNAGDSLICYFPGTFDSSNKGAFEDVLDCGQSMLSVRQSISSWLELEGLPALNYRVSADYGRVAFAVTRESANFDLFGSTVNICAKINSKAPPNGMVIGGDLYRLIKSLSIDHYLFREIRGLSLTKGQPHYFDYPIYEVTISKDAASKQIVAPCTADDGSDGTLPAKSSLVASPLGTFLQITSGETRESLHGSDRRSIMIVDDEPDVLLTLRSYLADEGYPVETFCDAEEALKHFALDPSRFGLVILDIRMPKVNGLQLWQRLYSISSKTKIIFVTALDAASELFTLLPRMEKDDNICYMRKPVSPERFVNTVRKYVNAPTTAASSAAS